MTNRFLQDIFKTHMLAERSDAIQFGGGSLQLTCRFIPVEES